ncbi:hypothetical protein FKP32DRAFT_89742 [Trametes sanguinea]|nr:hypothetical protein FKP32DRAFT_89742 [Trametes sanguinea]
MYGRRYEERLADDGGRRSKRDARDHDTCGENDCLRCLRPRRASCPRACARLSATSSSTSSCPCAVLLGYLGHTRGSDPYSMKPDRYDRGLGDPTASPQPRCLVPSPRRLEQFAGDVY